MKGKKGVSPIVSTVLLIMVVVIMAIIILFWAKGFVKEAIEKEIAGSKKRVNEFCLDVRLKSILNSDGSFGFENTGNVPLYAFNLKLTDGGSSRLVKISTDAGGSVNPGFSVIVDDQGKYSDYDEVKVIPILLGQSDNGQREFECPEKNGFLI